MVPVDERTNGRAVRARIGVGGRRRIVPRCAWGVGGRKFGRGRDLKVRGEEQKKD